MRFKTKKTTGVLALPATLWQFYKWYAVPGYGWQLLLWTIIVLAHRSEAIIIPYVEKLTIEIFEQTVPAGSTLFREAIPYVLGIIGLNYFLNITWVAFDWLQAHVAPKIKNRISEVLTSYVHNQSMSFWTSKMAGSINSQINYIAQGFNVFYSTVQMLGVGLVILVNTGILFALNMNLAFILVAALIVRIVYAWYYSKKAKRLSEHYSSTDSTLSGKLVDSFSNYAVVKYFAGAEKEQKALVHVRSRLIFWSVIQRYVSRIFWAFTGFLWDALFGVTILLCVLLYQRGEIELSNVVYTISVYHWIMGTVTRFMEMLPEIIENIGKAKKAYKELVMPISVVDKPNAPDLVVKKGLIEFKHIVFGYRNRPVLTDLMLRIKPGERVGIVGSSGAGKTTLVNLLMRFYEPKHGHILIDGQDIADVKQDSLRSQIAFIPQDPAMFNRTIGENIGYGKTGATTAEIRKAAKSASADEFIMKTEKKYNSLVGDKGIKLSGGQRQRIAIARAFLKDAPILVLDEATSALDSETEVAIQESFEKLSKGRTTIAIAHRLSTLRNMDRIIVLDHGVIVEQGTHQQLLRRKGKYYQLWQMQSGGFLQEEKHK